MDVIYQIRTAILVWCVFAVLKPGKGALIDSSCDGKNQVCYYLYEDTETLNVTEAFRKCNNAGQTLATIEDEKTQDVISKLDNVDNTLAWLAAKISDNEEWRTLDGKTIQDINYEPGTGFRCSAYKPTETGQIFFGTPCRIPDNPDEYLRLSVCQSAPEQGRCPERTRLVGENCYALPPNGTFTAFDGNTVCGSYTAGSTLAYTGINQQSFHDFVRDRLSAVTRNHVTKLEVWTGVFRKPWVWLRGALNGMKVQMMYTNWQAFYGTEESGHCLSISLNNGKAWINRHCNDSLRWYICQGEAMTTVTGSDAETTSVMGGSQITGSDAKSNSVMGGSQKSIIIIASVTTIMILIILIASILICLRYSSRRKSTDGGDGDELKCYNYIGNPSAAGSVRASELSPSTVGDKTNRELTPFDFDLLSGTRRSQPNSQTAESHEFFWGENQ